jgi:leucyl-tRNA synthetase
VTRLALLFTRPWDADGDFDGRAVAGVERFLARAWRAVTAEPGDDDHAPAVARAAARVGTSIDRLQGNTAIAALMELVNRFSRSAPSPAAQRALVLLLAPLAPHVAEELWARSGGAYSVHDQPWPDRPVSYDAAEGSQSGRVAS